MEPSGAAFLSSFVGRAAELEDVTALIAGNRLVTLVGFGGLGKTRLAHRALDLTHAEYTNTWSVNLADLVEAPLLGHTVAAAVGIPGGEDVDALAAAIGDQPSLLLLDNCEHLLDAVAALVCGLLARCPGLRVLATSRQTLSVPGEAVFPVPVMQPGDALQLFSERAVSTLASWRLADENRGAVVGVCEAVECVPLAIELAAVQISAFSPADMARRLSDQAVARLSTRRGETARSMSLEACISWSHELCTEEERALWARLSVFGGGFSLDAVESVCSGDGLDAIDVYATVAGLVEKSILFRDGDEGESRYRMLEVIRQFGSARLDADARQGWRRRHRDYYLALADRFDAEWTGPDQVAWMTRLRKEHVNLRLAFDFSVADALEAPQAMRMCTVLEHYFASTGGGAEAVHWLQRAVAHGTGTSLERASALRVGCFVAAIMGQLDTAAEMYDAMVPLLDQGDDRIRAYALYAGAVLRTWQGDAIVGAELALEGTELLAKLKDVGKEANLHFLRGMMLGWADRPDEAAAAYQQCLDLTQPRGERWLTSYSLWGLGVDALLAGRLDDAVRLERAALEAKAVFGDQLGIGLTVEALAWAAAERGQGKVAALLLGSAQAVWDALGTPVAGLPYLLRRREEGIAAARRLLPSVEFDEVHERGRTTPQSAAIEVALGRSRMSQAELETLLTRREREVARMLARGASNRTIADELFISVRTAETHVENILRKLDLDGRSQVADAISALA